MKITLRQIEAFYWTARLGTIHGAAKHLHFSQPAISARIKELEAVLKTALFTRVQQRVELTATGRHALGYAERLLSAGQDFERLGGGPPLEGTLRLGADESTAIVGLTEILRRLKARHPKLTVELSIEVGAVLTVKLRERKLDIALHTNSGAGSHVVDEQIGWVEFQWIASRGMATTDGDFLPAEAAGLPIVTNSPPSTLNGIVQKWLRSGGFDFDGGNSCNSLSLMLSLVRAGHAIAVLPVAILREHLLSGELRVLPASPPIPATPFYVSYLDEERGPGIAAITETARAVLDDARFFMRMALRS
jgi:DNA-binding transcriptional LysR family regulator